MHRGGRTWGGEKGWMEGGEKRWGLQFPKFEADKAIAVASLLPIDRDECMRAEERVGLEYLECRRRTWL